jgi:hypothetical protein
LLADKVNSEDGCINRIIKKISNRNKIDVDNTNLEGKIDKNE